MIEDLRSEDFRRAWAHALARALTLTEATARDLETTRQALAEQGEEMKEMIEVIPQWVREAKSHLKEVADKQISRIEHSHEEMRQTQRAFLAQFEAERNFFEGQRQDLALRLADVYRAQQALEEKRREFNSLSIWKRIFAKA